MICLVVLGLKSRASAVELRLFAVVSPMRQALLRERDKCIDVGRGTDVVEDDCIE